MTQRVLFVLLIGSLLASCSSPIAVDTIIHNATVYTVDDAFSKAEAIAIKDGKIVDVGPEHKILNGYSAENKLDAQKAFIYPGFIDAHAHFLGYAIQKERLDLIGTESFDDVIDRLNQYVADHEDPWILGRGWDQNDWENKAFPTNDTLSLLFPDKFIVLNRVDGHAVLASQNVLDLAGISRESVVQGGQVLSDENGTTGVLIDAAVDLLEDVVPEVSRETKSNALINAQNDCFSVGLTTVADAGLAIEEIELIKDLHQKDLKIRIYAMYSASREVFNNLPELKIITERLHANSVKLYADGALGSRGALLLEPYSDDTTNNGLLITPEDSIYKWAQRCYDHGFQLNVHCIGDASNRIVLDAMGKVLGGSNDRRWRIEHAQVVHPEDRASFGTFNVIPSMQPTHATSDMYWAEERLGSTRIQAAYALNSLKEQNGLIALGTDFPVEAIDPLNTFISAVTRKDAKGFPEAGFQMSEALSREDALRGMTIWAAVANFGESTVGSIEAGKFADIVMLNKDIMNCSESELRSVRAVKTWVNGELVYSNQ